MTARPTCTLEKGQGETVTMGVSLESYLLDGETVASILGHSVAALEGSPAALTVSNVQASAQEETFNGFPVAAGRAILWTCAAGEAGYTYRLFVAFTTSTGDTKDVRLEIVVTENHGVT